jgi:CDP-diacylglycerol--glycerol-3-phosphate 3-phosphatidyltransferase/archaetidylinositol phosphate synthase
MIGCGIGGSPMGTLNREIRRNYEALMLPVGRQLAKVGVSANAISGLAVGAAGVACWAFATGRLGLGLGFVLASVVIDMLDGSVARATGKASAFGMVVDHTTDRYSELLYVFGLCYGGYAPFWLGLLCLFSMLMPSYVRAKVESSGSGRSCQGIGIAERKEKLTILVVSIVLAFFIRNAVIYGFTAITVISQISAFQRLHFASRGGA